jgi:hypothetical protein
MGVWEGLLGGFEGRRREVDTINRQAAEASAARESKLFETLLSSPDPEIQALAVTGMLESAQPKKRKGGFSGFIGEYEGNPVMTTPSRSVTTQTMQPPPSIHAAAQSPTAITQVGAPPPQPLQWKQNAPQPTGETTTVMRPRQMFPTPEQTYRAQARGKAQGDVEGEVAGLVAAGFTEAEARELVKQDYLRRTSAGSPYQAIAGEIPDGRGGFTRVSAVFDRSTGTYIDQATRQQWPNFRPLSTTASRTLGVYFERAAQQAGYANGSAVPVGAETERVNQIAAELSKQDSQGRTLGAGLGRYETPADLNTARQNNVAVGTTAASVEGQRVPSQAIVDQRRGVENVRDQLAKILGSADQPGLISVLPKQTDLVGGIAPGAIMALKRRSRNDRVAVAELDSALQSIVNVMARSVAEQRGAQTEADAVRAEAAIVQMRDAILSGDTQESASARINQSLQLLDQILGRLPAIPVTTQPIIPGPGGPPPAPAQAPAAPQMKQDASGNWVITY